MSRQTALGTLHLIAPTQHIGQATIGAHSPAQRADGVRYSSPDTRVSGAHQVSARDRLAYINGRARSMANHPAGKARTTTTH